MNIVTRETLPLLSFIIGFGIAVMLFHKPFQFKKVLAMPVDEIHGKNIRVDGKCYRYIAEDTQCEILPSK
jgi:predicted membrane protein